MGWSFLLLFSRFMIYFYLILFSGSFSSNDVGGMYPSSGYAGDYMPRGSDVCPILSFIFV